MGKTLLFQPIDGYVCMKDAKIVYGYKTADAISQLESGRCSRHHWRLVEAVQPGKAWVVARDR